MPVIHLNADQEAEVSRRQLLEAAATMPAQELDQFIDELMTARARKYAPNLPAAEAALLERINSGPSEKQWTRFSELVRRREDETITDAELAELMKLVEVVEDYQVVRIEALAALARMRGMPLPELMQSLGIKSPGYV